MNYDPENLSLKNVYLPKRLYCVAEKQAENEFMNLSAYLRQLIVEDLKRKNKILDGMIIDL